MFSKEKRNSKTIVRRRRLISSSDEDEDDTAFCKINDFSKRLYKYSSISHSKEELCKKRRVRKMYDNIEISSSEDDDIAYYKKSNAASKKLNRDNSVRKGDEQISKKIQSKELCDSIEISSAEDENDNAYYKTSNADSSESKTVNTVKKDNNEMSHGKKMDNRDHSVSSSYSSENARQFDFSAKACRKRKHVSATNSGIEMKKRISPLKVYRVVESSSSSTEMEDNNIHSTFQRPSMSNAPDKRENDVSKEIKGNLEVVQDKTQKQSHKSVTKLSNSVEIAHSNDEQVDMQPNMKSDNKTNVHAQGFHSCFMKVLDSIKKTFSVYESRLSHLTHKYFRDESIRQDDTDMVMFIFTCIMSKLKEDLDAEENNLGNSYNVCKKEWQNSCEKPSDKKCDILVHEKKKDVANCNNVSRNNEVSSREAETAVIVEAKTTTTELKVPKNTRTNTIVVDDYDSSSRITAPEQEKPEDSVSISPIDFFDKLPSLRHLSQITIINKPKEVKSIKSIVTQENSTLEKENEDHFRKPLSIIDDNRGEQEIECVSEQNKERDYDSDFSTCSTVLYRGNAKRKNNANRLMKSMARQRYAKYKPKSITSFSRIHSNKRRALITSDLDHSSTGTEDEDDRVRFSPERNDYDITYSSNSNNTTNYSMEKGKLGSEVSQRIIREASPVVADISLLNDMDLDEVSNEGEERRSEDVVDHESIVPKISKKPKDTSTRDKKLQMVCVVKLQKLQRHLITRPGTFSSNSQKK